MSFRIASTSVTAFRVASSPSRRVFSTTRQTLRSRVVAVGAAGATAVILTFRFRSILYAKAIDTDISAPPDQAVGRGLIPYSEVQKHNSPKDCWVVIEGKVYDLTNFAAEGHPGGSEPIHRVAGRDATGIFKPMHPPGTIENGLDESAYVGVVDPNTIPAVISKEAAGETGKKAPSLGEIIGIPDFDAAAQAALTSKAWAFMMAGATDEYSRGLNRSSWNSILFRPRSLINVDEIDTRTQMMGYESSLPIFIAPTGMAGLAHRSGERLIAKAAGETGLIQMISTNASAPLSEIVESKLSQDQTFFMQLYVDKNRSKTENLLKKINSLDVKAIFVTVDAAVSGKREADERGRAEIEVASGISGGKISQDKRGAGIGRSVGGFIDPKLCWDDIAWLRKQTNIPIGLKGVGCVEDAKRAADMGINAIYVSNHGGRALDSAPPGLYTLLEIRKLAPEVFDKCEVYVDGGVRRGTDVVKAMCLGAKGVGLGRPFLYALTYGQEGIVHAVEILRDEIQTTMRLLGVTSIDQLGPHLLNTKAIDPLLADKLEYGPKERK